MAFPEPQEFEGGNFITFGNSAIRKAPDGTVYVGFIPTITAPNGLAQPHRALDFSPVLLPEGKLRELLEQQRKNGKPLVLLGHVIIQPAVSSMGPIPAGWEQIYAGDVPCNHVGVISFSPDIATCGNCGAQWGPPGEG